MLPFKKSSTETFKTPLNFALVSVPAITSRAFLSKRKHLSGPFAGGLVECRSRRRGTIERMAGARRSQFRGRFSAINRYKWAALAGEA